MLNLHQGRGEIPNLDRFKTKPTMNEEEMKNAVETAPEEAVETPATETEAPARTRGAMRDHLKSRYADKDWESATDDEMDEQSIKDYDELRGRMAERDKADEAMGKLFSENGQAASFLMGMANGEDFLVNLQKNFGADIVEAMQNPDKLEELSKANKEFQQKVAKNKELQAAWEQNMATSLENIAAKQEELGLSDEDVEKGMDKLADIVNEYNNGNLSMETIQMFLKAENHDADVAAASREGEVKGRNANIEEKLRKSRKENGSVPNLGGQNRHAEGRRIERSDMGVGGNIWERGNFKRVNR